jgi:hypothetical protein
MTMIVVFVVKFIRNVFVHGIGHIQTRVKRNGTYTNHKT